MALWDRQATQTQLAAALGLDASAVSRLLRGQRRWEFGEVLAAAEFLDIAVADLLPPPARQRLVSVSQDGPDTPTPGGRGTGWFARDRRVPRHRGRPVAGFPRPRQDPSVPKQARRPVLTVGTVRAA